MTTTNPIPTRRPPTPEPPGQRRQTRGGRLLGAFLDGTNSPCTRRAYEADLETFRQFLGSKTVEAAVEKLLRLPDGEACLIGLEFKAWLQASGKSPSTICRRVSCLRSLVRLARRCRFVAWTIDVDCPRTRPLRDTRGPGLDGYRAMLAACDRTDAIGFRDRLILRLLFDLGLRRSEAAGLDLRHVDIRGRRLAVLGKGNREREWLEIPVETLDSLQAWLSVRGPADGPLLPSLEHGQRLDLPVRLSDSGLYKVVRQAGRAVGIRCTPHGLRHAAITVALACTNGNLRQVQMFSRHRSVQTILLYDDARRNQAREVADMVAGSAQTPPRNAVEADGHDKYRYRDQKQGCSRGKRGTACETRTQSQSTQELSEPSVTAAYTPDADSKDNLIRENPNLNRTKIGVAEQPKAMSRRANNSHFGGHRTPAATPRRPELGILGTPMGPPAGGGPKGGAL